MSNSASQCMIEAYSRQRIPDDIWSDAAACVPDIFCISQLQCRKILFLKYQHVFGLFSILSCLIMCFVDKLQQCKSRYQLSIDEGSTSSPNIEAGMRPGWHQAVSSASRSSRKRVLC